MVVPWALAPIRRLVLVLLAVSLSPLSLGSSLTYTVWRLVGVQPLDCHYTAYLLSKLTMRKVERSHSGRQRGLSWAARLADNVNCNYNSTVVQYSFTGPSYTSTPSSPSQPTTLHHCSYTIITITSSLILTLTTSNQLQKKSRSRRSSLNIKWTSLPRTKFWWFSIQDCNECNIFK